MGRRLKDGRVQNVKVGAHNKKLRERDCHSVERPFLFGLGGMDFVSVLCGPPLQFALRHKRANVEKNAISRQVYHITKEVTDAWHSLSDKGGPFSAVVVLCHALCGVCVCVCAPCLGPHDVLSSFGRASDFGHSPALNYTYI